jgi:hypothetical protein
VALGRQRRERLERPADANLDDVRQSRAGEVGAGDLGIARVDLERDQSAVGRQRPREQIVL